MSKIFLLFIHFALLMAFGCIQPPGGDSTITVTNSRDPEVNQSLGGGGAPVTVSTPSSVVLTSPGSTPGSILPTITVGGVSAGNTVSLYENSNCTGTVYATGTVSGGLSTINLSVASLTSGNVYTFFAKQFNTSGTGSSCSTEFALYQYLANAPSITSMTVNNGDTVSTSLNVSVAFVAQDFTKLCLSENSDPDLCAPYLTTTSSPQSFTLANTQGSHTVYLHVKNDLNQTATLSDAISVDTVVPSVSSTTLPSDSTYVDTDILDFTLSFDDNVTVSGTPRLPITLGSGTVYADYQSGSGSSNLVFRYTVGSSDLDSDGIALPASIDLNGGTIRDNNNNNAALSFSTASTAGILIDGAAAGQPSSISFTVTGATSINANGIATTTLKATVLDISSSPVNGASVTLNIPTNGGTASANPVSTDVNGEATFTITSSLTAGTYSYSATTAGPLTSSTADVTFTSSPAGSVTLSITGGNPITADGVATTTLEATVLDGGAAPIAGEVVTLSIPTNGGTVSSTTATTNGSGVASWTLTSSTLADGYSYSASVAGPITSNSVSLVMDPGTATVTEITTPLSDGTVDGSTTVNIKAFDANGNLATGYNSNYTLNASGGATGGGVFTFSSGEANIPISSTTIQTVTLTLVDSDVTGANPGSSQQLYFGHGAADSIIIIDPADSVAGTATDVVLEVHDQHGNIVEDFSGFIELVLGGSATGEGAINLTGGVETVSINDTVAETVSITFLDTFNTNLIVNASEDVIFDAGSPASISLSITGASALRANAVATTTILATVLDANSNPVPGEDVTLNIPTDGGTASTNPVATDASGEASFTLTSSTTVGSYNYSATTVGPLTSSDVSIDFTGALITSTSQSADSTFIIGETFQIVTSFDDNITVTGSPRIALTLTSGTVYADYVSGSTSSDLLFEYVVLAGDEDLDGIAVATTIDLNGGTLKDPGTADAFLGIPALTTTGVNVDGNAPVMSSSTVPSSATYIIGNTITFNAIYDQSVTVTGTPRLALTLDSGTVYADYASGDGTDTLNFQYTVQANDLDSDGISVNSTIDLNSGTIKDAAGNVAELDLGALVTSGILMDGVAPSSSSSSQPTDNTYIEGDNLDFTLTFNETVVVSGTPRLEITLDSGTVYAEYNGGTGSDTLTFRYTTSAGDEDNNGIVVNSTIDLNAGTIKDSAGNNAILGFSALTTTGILVDAVAPSISSTSQSPDATYLETESLSFTLNYNEAVEVTGTPYIAIDLGGTTVNATYSSGDGTSNIEFSYTIVADDEDLDGVSLVSTSVELSGGTLKDAAGNDASLDLSGQFSSLSGVKVDAVYPVLEDLTQPSNGTIHLGETLDFLANFDDDVTVSGSPRLVLTIGATTRYATYSGGSGSSQIRFSYTIASGDNDGDGIVVSDNIDLNSGTIKDASTNDAVVTFSGLVTSGILTSDTAIATKITAAPTPSSGMYIGGANLNINLTYSANVTVTGAPRIPIVLNSGVVYADYLAGSGSTFLTFQYTVGLGDKDIDGIKISTEIDLNGGAIKDGSTADADTNFAVMSTKNIFVDGAGPVITDISTSASGTYPIGEVLQFKVTFDEEPIITGTPQLILNLGNASTLNADFTQIDSGNSKIAIFELTIPEGTSTSIDSADEITLNGGTLQDSDTNPGDLTADTLHTFASLDFDGIKPTLGAGNFSVNFSSVPYSFTQIPSISITSAPEAGLANIRIKVYDVTNSLDRDSYTMSFPTPPYDLASDFNSNAVMSNRMLGNTTHRLDIQVQDAAGNWSLPYSTTEQWTTFHECGETIESSCYDGFSNTMIEYLIYGSTSGASLYSYSSDARTAGIAVSPLYDGVGWVLATATIADANTMSVWVQDLNENGVADTAEINDPTNWMSADGMGMPARTSITDATLIRGRSKHLKTYFTVESEDSLDNILESTTHNKTKGLGQCHFANINSNPASGCAAMGMRLPTSKEIPSNNTGSTYNTDSCAHPLAPRLFGAASAGYGEVNGSIPGASANFLWTASAINDETNADNLTSSRFLAVSSGSPASYGKDSNTTNYKYTCISDYKEYELTFEKVMFGKTNEEFYLDASKHINQVLYNRAIDYSANSLKAVTGVEYKCYYDVDIDGVVTDANSCDSLTGATFTTDGKLTFTPTSSEFYEFKITAINSADSSLLDNRIFLLNIDSLPAAFSSLTIHFCDTAAESCYDYMDANATLNNYAITREGKFLAFQEKTPSDGDPKLFDWWSRVIAATSNGASGASTSVKLMLAADGSDNWSAALPELYSEITFRAKGVGLYYTDAYSTSKLLDGVDATNLFLPSSTSFPGFSQSEGACDYLNQNAVGNNPCAKMGMLLPTGDDMGSSQSVSPSLDACNYSGSKDKYGGVTPTTGFVPDTTGGVWTSSLADTGSGDILVFNNSTPSQVPNNSSKEYRCVIR